VAVAYRDFPAVEWTVYFKNSGDAATPILEGIQGLDTALARNGEGEFVLHHSKGTPNSPTDYQPFQTVLERKAEKRISAAGGRPTNSDLCYFNVAWPGEGLIVALGWPGQWAAQFTRDEGPALHVRAGQELTHFRLLPGEEVRTPLVALLFWKGDWIRGQNLWRRWMLAHNLPRPGGRLPPPQIAGGSNRQYNEMQEGNEENQKMFLDRFLEEGLKIDYWWMDAGWYPFQAGWWNTGTWEPDSKRFPRGLRAVSDYAHGKGVKTIVWFEPERVHPGTWLYEKHPEWLLGRDGQNKLLDLGNPEAWRWLTDHIGKLLTDQGIDLYRQDFNFDPLPYWRANDAEDRQGISEIRHVMGYLAFWDELRRRHPNLLIDTCASGGRRNDLETLRRAVPLWRSDYAFETTAMQLFTYGIALWIPYFGTGINTFDPYGFRSQMTPALALGWDLRRKDRDYNSLRRLVAQWRQVADYYYGDYYPLLPYSTSNEEWMGWQYDRPELGEGMVQVFRRPTSSYESARLKLRGLEPTARYAVTNLDFPGPAEVTGQELMSNGLHIFLKNQPDSVIITYQRVKTKQTN
jgi:alpha-galactosidase